MRNFLPPSAPAHNNADGRNCWDGFDDNSDMDLDDDDTQISKILLTLSSPALLPSVITEGLVDSMNAFNFL